MRHWSFSGKLVYDVYMRLRSVKPKVPGSNPTFCYMVIKCFLYPSSPWEISLWLKGKTEAPLPFFVTLRRCIYSCVNHCTYKLIVLLMWPSVNQMPQNWSCYHTLNHLMHTFQRLAAVSGKWVTLNTLYTSFVSLVPRPIFR